MKHKYTEGSEDQQMFKTTDLNMKDIKIRNIFSN